ALDFHGPYDAGHQEKRRAGKRDDVCPELVPDQRGKHHHKNQQGDNLARRHDSLSWVRSERAGVHRISKVARSPDHAIVERMFRFPGRALGLAIFIAALVLAGCQQRHGENVVQGETVNETSPLPRLPVAEPPMDRAALLLAAARAVSATGLARDDSEEQRHLDGKAFELRIRFGCMPADPQPQTSRDAFVVRYDARARTLRVRAAPDLTLDDPETEALAG